VSLFFLKIGFYAEVIKNNNLGVGGWLIGKLLMVSGFAVGIVASKIMT
jgi:hypothetical protein